MKFKRVDHLVLTVNDIAKAVRFYHEVFDMPIIDLKDHAEPHCVRCGHQLIEFQTAVQPQKLAAPNKVASSATFCIVTGDQLEEVCNHLKSYYVPIIAGPIEQFGSEGQMTAIYIHDCDQNLIEIASYKDR
jgi:catechol-2,3-dioxygenase